MVLWQIEDNVSSKFKHRLTIAKTGTQDAGVIKVIVKNKFGEKTHQAKVGCLTPAKITKPTQDGGAGRGGSHTFHAVIDGECREHCLQSQTTLFNPLYRFLGCLVR